MHPLLGAAQPTPEPSWLCDIDRARTPWFGEHVIGGASILPASAYIEIALAAGSEANGDGVQLDHLDLLDPVTVAPADAEPGQVRVSLSDDRRLVVAGRGEGGWRTHARGRVGMLRAQAPRDVDLAPWRCGTTHDVGEFYADGAAFGYGWGPAFQVLREIRWSGDRMCARYELGESPDAYRIHGVA